MQVELIDVMGSDDRVVDAARVSFQKEASNYSTEENHKLIQFLARHNHFTPFSHVMITMRETVPIFVARQRFKHMVGFTYNEVSRRYVDDPPQFYIPDTWRKRADNKKQGSLNEGIERDGLPLSDAYNITYNQFLEYAEWLYNTMLADEVAPEQARMVLPQSTYTSYYVTGSLAAWARAYKLRIEEHAQKEIQDLAKLWDKVIRAGAGLKYSWEALTDDRR